MRRWMSSRCRPGKQTPYAEVWFTRSTRRAGTRRRGARTRDSGRTASGPSRTNRSLAGGGRVLEPHGYEGGRRYVIPSSTSQRRPCGSACVRACHFANDGSAPTRSSSSRRSRHATSRAQRSRSVSEAWLRVGAIRAIPRRNRTSSRSMRRPGARPNPPGTARARTSKWKNVVHGVAREARGRGIGGRDQAASRSRGRRETSADATTPTNEEMCGSAKDARLNRRFGYRTLYDEIVLRGPAAERPPAGSTGSDGGKVQPKRGCVGGGRSGCARRVAPEP